MKKRKSFIATIAIICVLAQLAACSNTSKKPSGEEKLELVVAADGRSAILSEMVYDFNQKSEDYRIRLEYYNLTADKTTEHLRTEIIAGHAPDIYVFSQKIFSDVTMPIYEDLLPYLEADPDYGREDFVPGLYDAMTQGGSLYYLPSEFFINTYTARASVIGNRTGLTMEEAVQLTAELGPDITVFPAWMDRMIVLTYVVNFSAAKFMDRSAGTCDFLNPEFLKLLEICKAHPEPDPEAFSDSRDKSLLNNSLIQILEAFAVRMHRLYGSDYRFAGFPTQSRQGSSFGISQRMSISSTSKHKEAAWAFIRMVLDVKNQANTEYLPVIQSELDKRIALAREENETMPEAKLEDYDIEQFNRLLNSIDLIEDGADTTLYLIIAEEAGAYFSGDRTLEEAAEIIQSRVSIYVSETK